MQIQPNLRRLVGVFGVLLVGTSFVQDVQAKLKIVATLPDLGAIAREIGGAHADVTVLASATEDPHYVDPKPSLILPLNRADVLILNGLELEIGWLPPLLVNARNSKIQQGGQGYFDASAFAHRMEVPKTRIDRSMGDIHPGGNPHFTFDPRQAACIGEALGSRLAALAPEHAAAFGANAQRFAHDLRTLAEAEATRFRALPKERRHIISYHQSLVYLLDWLGIHEVSAIEPRPGIPPDPAQVAKVLKLIRTYSIRAIIQEEHYPRRTSQTLAKLGKVKLLVIPTATRFKKGERYIDHLKAISKELYDALAS